MNWISVEEELPTKEKEVEFRFKDPFGGGTCIGNYIGEHQGLFEPLREKFPIFRGSMQGGTVTTKDAFEWRYTEEPPEKT